MYIYGHKTTNNNYYHLYIPRWPLRLRIYYYLSGIEIRIYTSTFCCRPIQSKFITFKQNSLLSVMFLYSRLCFFVNLAHYNSHIARYMFNVYRCIKYYMISLRKRKLYVSATSTKMLYLFTNMYNTLAV